MLQTLAQTLASDRVTGSSDSPNAALVKNTVIQVLTKLYMAALQGQGIPGIGKYSESANQLLSDLNDLEVQITDAPEVQYDQNQKPYEMAKSTGAFTFTNTNTIYLSPQYLTNADELSNPLLNKDPVESMTQVFLHELGHDLSPNIHWMDDHTEDNGAISLPNDQLESFATQIGSQLAQVVGADYYLPASQWKTGDDGVYEGTFTSDPNGAPVYTPPPPPPGADAGQSFYLASNDVGATGSTGNDTFIVAASGGDTINTGGGADTIVLDQAPQQTDTVTGFTTGADRVSFAKILNQLDYNGTDPIADGYIALASDGNGGTNVFVNSSPGTGATGQPALNLVGVDPSALNWANLSGMAPDNFAEAHIFRGVEGDTIGGTISDDTIDAAVQGGETFTGGGGDDEFIFSQENWQTDTITDFTLGQDKIDLSAVMQQIGYTGSNPIADGYIKLLSDGNGGTNLYIDASPATNQWGQLALRLPGVDPSQINWTDLSGPGGGRVIMGVAGDSIVGTADNDIVNGAAQGGETLTGGGGADTFVLKQIPAQADTITDFALGLDSLDLGRIMEQIGYTGSDPITDGYVTLQSDGSGGTEVYVATSPGAAGQLLVRLENVSPAQISWSNLANQTQAGETFNGVEGDTLVGTGGGDTFNAAKEGAETFTGGAGDDRFVFSENPWQTDTITDFTQGQDTIDLTAVMAQIGYTGSDPIADGYIKLFSDGNGGTNLFIDASPTTNQWGSFELRLPGVDPSTISWAELSGHIATQPSHGQVYNGVEGDALIGTDGNDTFNASKEGAETMYGGAGDDTFVFAQAPWMTDTVNDFTLGEDKIDLTGVMAQIGYTGSDPIADGYIKLFSDGYGGTNLYIDASPSTDQWGSFELHLPGVDPSKLSWADLGGPKT